MQRPGGSYESIGGMDFGGVGAFMAYSGAGNGGTGAEVWVLLIAGGSF
jgi:hypothetical protein